MEASSCVKAVVVAANQYMNSTSDTHLVHLQRQLDVLVSVTAKDSLLAYFAPNDLLPTQCLTCLVELLNEPHVKPSLAQKIILLLNNLADEEVIRESLHRTFHVTVCLANYLRCTMASASDPIVLQCVKLLQRVTYNCRISFQETYLDDLIKFVIKHIQAKENELTQPCLGLLANLSKHNFSVQNHIRNMENVKAFYKALIMYPLHKNKKTVIFALSILTNLCMNEELGEFLFKAQNIHQTFQLMFNILLHDDSGTTRMYAVDLFQDILHQPRIQDHLIRYDHLEGCIGELLQLIGKAQRQSVAKIFELLLSFCSVTGIRCVVCRLVLATAKLQDHTRFQQMLINSHLQCTEPFFAILQCAAQSIDGHDDTPLLALEFLKEIYQEVIDLGLVGQVNPRVDQVLPLVTEVLMAPLDTTGPTAVRHCSRAVRALQLLTALSSDDSLQAQAATAITSDICVKLIEHQLTHNQISTSQPNSVMDPHDWSEVGVELVLYTLDIMTRFRRHVVKMDSSLNELLQDGRLVPFLAFAMTSDNRQHIHMALNLITRGAALPDFPTIVLGESIAANNNAKSMKRSIDKELALEGSSPPSPKRVAWTMQENKENQPTHKPNMLREQMNTALDNSVELLIEKMQTGMELKDVRTSEIINVYEHKLQSLQTKENHLQDLLEAKALALAQADRLISQYRCRRAQSDAEAQKLRSLLQESEQGAEEHREKRQEAETDRERLTTELEQAILDITRLDAIAADYESLTEAHREQMQRLENTTRTLGTLKQEHQTLSEMHEMLRRHNETLKQQYDVATEQLLQLEEERKALSRIIKEKEAHETDLSKNLSKMEEHLRKSGEDRDELEKAIDRLRLDLTKTEKKKKDLQHQVSTLEVVCQKHEDAIAEKDITLNAQKTELEKHAQIAALIHNLSSGAPPVS